MCCTRPKKRLIFYDEDEESRDIIMRFWKKVDVIDVIDESMIE